MKTRFGVVIAIVAIVYYARLWQKLHDATEADNRAIRAASDKFANMREQSGYPRSLRGVSPQDIRALFRKEKERSNRLSQKAS